MREREKSSLAVAVVVAMVLVVLTVVMMVLVMIQARNSPPKFNTCHLEVEKKRPVSVVVMW